MKKTKIIINTKEFERALNKLDPGNNFFYFDGVQSISSGIGKNYDAMNSMGYQPMGASAGYYQSVAKEQGINECWRQMVQDYKSPF